jgi:hypothetical protein
MSALSNIQYLAHHQIQKSKWDKCISEAENGLIYGYSFYLDHMAKHWDALMINDYEIIMPLTWNKKFGIYYLYQPAFTANLGIFGNGLTGEIVKEFIKCIPEKFKLIEISLNEGNAVPSQQGDFISRTNYVLSLNNSYENIYRGYRENHQRNIQKALQSECFAKKNIPVEGVISLNKDRMKNITSIPDDDYARFNKLYQFLFPNNKSMTYGIFNAQNKLLASCVFFFSHNRVYYILAGNHPDGRNTGASHALIDAFIKDHSEKNLILDFEGSDIESLAMFYNGFGATKEIYPAIRLNNLPWYLKWLKQ